MKEELKELFKKFPTLIEDEVNAIADNITVKSFKKGKVLLSEGSISKECYSVLKGCVRKYCIKNGEEKTTAFFTEGQAIASFTSYINQTPSNHYLVCAENCLLTVGTKEKEDEMCLKFPKLESIIRSEMEKNSGAFQEEYDSFITSSPEERYSNLIETRPELINRVPQHQIASYLGVTPESLSRIKKRIFLNR